MAGRGKIAHLHEIDTVSFSFLSDEEIRKLATVEITNPSSLDKITGEQVKGGLYDPLMGPALFGASCLACGLHSKECPGHCGYINLKIPLYNPLLFMEMIRIVKCSCMNCHSLLQSELRLAFHATLLAAIDYGLLHDAQQLYDLGIGKKFSHDVMMRLRTKVNLIADGKTEEAQSYSIQHSVTDKRVDTLLGSEGDAPSAKKNETDHADGADINIKPTLRPLPPPPVKRAETSMSNALRQLVVAGICDTTPAKNCSVCDAKKTKYRYDSDRVKIFVRIGENSEGKVLFSDEYREFLQQQYPGETRLATQPKDNTSTEVLVTPTFIKFHMIELWKKHSEIFSYAFSTIQKHAGQETRVSTPGRFFMSSMVVPANKYRPVNKTFAGLANHPQNKYYSDVIQSNQVIRGIDDVVDTYFINMQTAANNLFDSKRSHDRDPAPGIAQTLEKKEGLFRMNMMGKRVNFACRTVISPDPYLQTNQMGIPLYFAERLTYPEPVTERNYSEMAAAVVNGARKHPGALSIEDEHGRVISLLDMPEEERIAQSKLLRTFHENSAPHSIKKVHRHVRDGDVVLSNRQPTLHKPSIMSHFVKVLKVEKTLRMHYANCNTFNADFDGDEMNIHLPQDPLARSEAQTIAMADYQYITARNGGPLRGLIQDHVVTGVLLTMRDTFLDLAQFSQIVYSAVLEINHHAPVEIPQPAILKPKRLWTGKQVVTTVLRQIVVGRVGLNLNASAKVPDRMWGPNSGEGEVIIRDNELLTGVLDKSAFGASAYGLVHACYELYGAITAGQLLSCLSRLFTIYLQDVGFSCGMDDLLLEITAEEKRAELLLQANSIGTTVAQAYVKKERGEEGLADPNSIKQLLRDEKGRAALDNMMKSKTHPFSTQIVDHCLPDGQLKRFPYNYLSMMTVSGAKGASVNHSQISCLLGQQELEGRRVPVMQSGKTLPSFDAFDTSSRAGGYIADRFLTGIKPQEYFFHCMAGREGLVDTAVKTSRSGYLQRCLIKHMEGLKVCYDNTVRDSDGSVVQFFYGEDGVDVGETAFLKKFKFQAQNYVGLKERHWPNKTEIENVQNISITTAGKLFKELKNQKAEGVDLMDPVMSQISPHYNIGATSEKFHQELSDYTEKNPDDLFKSKTNPKGINPKKFKLMSSMRYHHALANAGEAVGLVAAQSIGEPSTQMTLNTFHLAGRGDVNVTLGIPRLRELLMTGSRAISTPGMTLPLHSGATERDADNLAKKLARVQVSEIVDDMTVSESYNIQSGNRHYNVSIKFQSEADTLRKHEVSYSNINTVMSAVFLKGLSMSLRDLSNSDSSTIKPVSSAKAAAADLIAAQALALEAETETGEQEPSDSSNKKTRKAKKASRKGTNDDISDRKRDQKAKDMTSYDDEDEREAVDGNVEDYSEDEREEAEESDTTEAVKFVDRYNFDKKTGIFTFHISMNTASKKILMLGVVEEQLKATPAHVVHGIQKAVVVKGKNDSYSIATEGINLEAACLLQEYFDVNRLVCNQPHAMNERYGIESGRQTIVSEISNVFGVYGIAVDFRHLSLIGDYMTKSGTYRAMNRSALSSNPSVYQKASFESTLAFIAKSSMTGDTDSSKSPSAGIVLGKVVETGTGTFECYQPIMAYS